MCLRLVRRVRKVEERSDRGERELPLVRSAQHCSHASSRLWATLRSDAPKQSDAAEATVSFSWEHRTGQ
jgi:hypothetical protein